MPFSICFIGGGVPRMVGGAELRLVEGFGVWRFISALLMLGFALNVLPSDSGLALAVSGMACPGDSICWDSRCLEAEELCLL